MLCEGNRRDPMASSSSSSRKVESTLGFSKLPGRERRSPVPRRREKAVVLSSSSIATTKLWLVAVFCGCISVSCTWASKGAPPAAGTGRATLTGGGNKRGRDTDRARRLDALPPPTHAKRPAYDVDTSDGDKSDDYDGYDEDDRWGDDWSEDDDGWDGPAGLGGAGAGGGGQKGKNGWHKRSGRRAQMLTAGKGMSGMRERLNNARRRASRAYREAKSLMSSEMEGVVLKATRPDDLPVKPKHLEALMRPTTEMPKEFNVYLPVVRKLWAKMADKEWRVAAKALYIVHRFAADGSTEHAVNLKESVAILRTHHDSRRKVKYFDMATICDVKPPAWSVEDVTPFAEFLKVYADYVLRRTTQFGPGFAELLDNYAMLLEAGEMLSEVSALITAGCKCVLRPNQEAAVTVAAAVQVVQDLRDALEVCSSQLDFLVREGQAKAIYPEEVSRWYDFLRENYEGVAASARWANELATRHNLSPPLRPLVATPLVLKFRDEEMASLEMEAAAATGQGEGKQQECPADAEAKLDASPAINATDSTSEPFLVPDTKSAAPDASLQGWVAAGSVKQHPATTKSSDAGVRTTTQTTDRRSAPTVGADGFEGKAKTRNTAGGSAGSPAAGSGSDSAFTESSSGDGNGGSSAGTLSAKVERDTLEEVKVTVSPRNDPKAAAAKKTRRSSSSVKRTSEAGQVDAKTTASVPKKVVPTTSSGGDSSGLSVRRKSTVKMSGDGKDRQTRRRPTTPSTTTPKTPSKRKRPKADGESDSAKKVVTSTRKSGRMGHSIVDEAPRSRSSKPARSTGGTEPQVYMPSTAERRPKPRRTTSGTGGGKAGTEMERLSQAAAGGSGRRSGDSGGSVDGNERRVSKGNSFAKKTRPKQPSVPPSQQARTTE